jgi:arabinan endo-1,5-alpha-L-arabinosidase
MGVDMLKGGGKLVIAANGRMVGPGHFCLIDLGDGVQKFSCHYEADLDRGGRSVLDIRALLWKNGWPASGEDFKGGTFEIESERSGYALEMGVEAVPLTTGRVRRGATGPVTPIPDQDVADVLENWPDSSVVTRLGDYMLQAHQKWTITPLANVGGYLGSPYFKITIAGTDRALTATEDGEVIVKPVFTGEPEQLWRIDQLIDGTYRIMSKAEHKTLGPLALTAVGVSTPSLAKFDPDSDKSRWNFKKL